MFNFFTDLPYSIQALIACLFTWAITSLGSAVVFLFKKVNKTILDALLGFAAGVMIAATFFSLLAPAIEMANKLNMITWLVVSLSFLAGGLLLFFGDKVFDHLTKKREITKNNTKRIIMLISSITLHNGIGIQNFPEGSAVSLPLRREGFGRLKSFVYGSLSGIVEPIAAVIGAILVLKIQYLLPILLAFAGGAMIYVVIQELIPESQANKKKNLMALFTILGFVIMMIFDVALG